ncbi:MAG TPA: DNA internalization-related competence protein ComEC/Rec2 [Bacilli bacterium]|nr:DNA internalization-related competence protein ComEC/Rec2 [Bacilli bacterium]
MLKLRKILLCNYPYYIFLIIAFLFFIAKTILIKYESKYDLNTNNITGKLIKYNIDGDKLSFIIKDKEKIKGIYYIASLKEKEMLIENLKLGITINIKGELTEPNNNTIPNTFNYKKYLYNHQIFYIMTTDEIAIVDNNPPFFYKIKNKLITRINSYSDTSSYLKMFILGDKSKLDEDIYKNYQTLGVSHLFAISGMHIGLFSGLLLFLLKKIRIKETKRYIITMLFLLFYIFLTSFAPSVMRATLFFSLLSLNKIFYTNIKILNIYILTLSILIIINPFILYDLGAEYSFLTSFGLIMASEKLSNKNYFVSLLKVSFIAFLFSLGVTGMNFYEVNLLSIINNLIFVPLVTFIIYPLSLLTLLLPFLNYIFKLAINLLELLSSLNLKIAFLIPKISIIFWIIYYILLILFIKKSKLRYLIIIFIMLILNRFHNNFDYNNYVYFLDVGQGDSAVIITKYQKEVVMIDTGGKVEYFKEDWQERNSTYNVSDSTITFLKSIGLNHLDLLIITHGDNDHIGDSFNLVNNLKIKKVIFNIGDYNTLENKLIKVLESKNIDYYQVPEVENIGDYELQFLNTSIYDNENDNSSVVYLNINNYKFLFMGDAGVIREEDILDKYNLIDIDFLKVGHHGSNTSSSEEFINSINPKCSLISVGKNNRYGHPKESVLNILANSTIYRTDQDGSILIKINNNKYNIKTYIP